MKLLILTQKVDERDPILGFFVSWLREFSKYADSIEIICLQKGNYSLPRNVTVHSLGKELGGGRFRYMWRFYRHLYTLRGRYDSVLVHMNPEYLILGGLLWRLSGKRVGLWYVHKSVNPQLRLGVLFAHHVFTASKESFRLPSQKTIITGHAIDTDLFRPDGLIRKVSPPTILTVGRLSPSKQVDVLIRAVEILKGKGMPCRLLIVGSAGTPEQKPYEESLRQYVDTHNLADTVTFLGDRSNEEIPAILRGASVFVNVSETGSMDKAVLEAMASGVLVITSNVAFKHMLQQYKEHLFVEKATPELVAEKIARALEAGDNQEVRTFLRESVIHDHSFKQTIERIMTAMKS